MSLKVFFSVFSSDGHFVQANGTILAICKRVTQRNISCEIIVKSGHWPARICCLKVFLFIALAAILFFGSEPFSNFGSGLPKKLFCEIILKSGHWPTRICHLKVFSIFNSGCHFVRQSKTILAVLIEGHPWKRSVKLF